MCGRRGLGFLDGLLYCCFRDAGEGLVSLGGYFFVVFLLFFSFCLFSVGALARESSMVVISSGTVKAFFSWGGACFVGMAGLGALRTDYCGCGTLFSGVILEFIAFETNLNMDIFFAFSLKWGDTGIKHN